VAEEGICEKRGRRERRILMRLKKLSAAMLAMTMAAGMMAVPAMAEEEEKQIEPCTVVFWHAMNGQQQDTLTALTEQFNEENEYGITVELVNQGYYSDLSTKLTASAVADTLPDLAQAYNNWLTPYLDKVIPLDDFIEDDFDDYEDIIESYRNECSAFGFVSSLPFNKSTYVYFYNKTMFDELGLEAPETWEDLVTIGETVMEEKGIASLGVDDLAGFLEASLFQNEGAYVTEDGPQFDTEEGLETVTYIMDLYNNGYARLVGEDGYFSTTISNQLVAAYIGSSTGVSYIDTTSGWELGVAPLPGNKTNAANQAGTNIVMFATDENQQLATWEYMKFLTSTEATVQWAMETGYLPVRTSGYESEEYQTFMEDDLASTAAYAQADAFFSSEAFDGSYDVMSTVNTKLEELILDEADAETAYEELLEAIREAMDLEEEEDKFF
jgi:multiple sugar transport system substrate-binding protein